MPVFLSGSRPAAGLSSRMRRKKASRGALWPRRTPPLAHYRMTPNIGHGSSKVRADPHGASHLLVS